jgi:hypothetical protein
MIIASEIWSFGCVSSYLLVKVNATSHTEAFTEPTLGPRECNQNHVTWQYGIDILLEYTVSPGSF